MVDRLDNAQLHSAYSDLDEELTKLHQYQNVELKHLEMLILGSTQNFYDMNRLFRIIFFLPYLGVMARRKIRLNEKRRFVQTRIDTVEVRQRQIFSYMLCNELDLKENSKLKECVLNGSFAEESEHLLFQAYSKLTSLKFIVRKKWESSKFGEFGGLHPISETSDFAYEAIGASKFIDKATPLIGKLMERDSENHPCNLKVGKLHLCKYQLLRLSTKTEMTYSELQDFEMSICELLEKLNTAIKHCKTKRELCNTQTKPELESLAKSKVLQQILQKGFQPPSEELFRKSLDFFKYAA